MKNGRKRKSDGHEVPKEIKSKRRKKKVLEVVDEDVVMSDEKKSTKVDGDVEMDESDKGIRKDADMEEHEISGPNDAANKAQAGVVTQEKLQATASQKGAQMTSKGVTTSTFHRITQGLRLPSQHTPKPPSMNLDKGATPVPPGGRRLFFETAKKKKGNKLLLDMTTQVEKKKQDEVLDSLPVTESSELQFESIGATTEDAISYCTIWVVVLFSLYMVINIAAFVNEDAVALAPFARWNVRQNIAQRPLTEPKVIENAVVDPDLMSQTKTKMQMQRREVYELNKINVAIEQTQRDLDFVNELMNQLSTSSPEMSEVLTSKTLNPSMRANANDMNEKLKSLYTSTTEKQTALLKWEKALSIAESSMDKLSAGDIDHEETNSVLIKLSEASLIGFPARILDTSTIIIPGEGCTGKDYSVVKNVYDTQDKEIDVVGGIDIEALDNAGDAPVRAEHAQAVYKNLMKYAQSTLASLMGNGPSVQIQNWIRHLIDSERKNKELDEPLDAEFDPLYAIKNNIQLGDGNVYTKNDVLNDIDRLLEVESADRTGIFDHAMIFNGARVLHRGPYATSPSLYESLPLVNRVLAYTKLRFYGHPPEVALVPSSVYGRGQCWSFTEERHHGVSGEIRGEYATLTVNLASPVFVTEVVVEHVPSGDMTSAIKAFRVLGFEDGGAFGEPFELGSFEYDISGEYHCILCKVNEVVY